MPDISQFSEGWIAAAGATLGAILLKVAERLLAARKDKFQETLTQQTHADERIQALWTRIDALQSERDTLWGRFHAAEEQHDARMREAESTHNARQREADEKYATLLKRYDHVVEQYQELRVLLRRRDLPEDPSAP